METLIAIHNDGEVKKRSYVKELAKLVETKIVNDFSSLLVETQKTTYKLVIVLTQQSSFPQNWEFEKLKMKCPVIMLTRVNEDSLIFIQSLIDSLETYKTQKTENPLLSKSLAYISENLYDSNLSLDTVSDHIYISKCHYSRLFHEKLGVGFKEYVIKKRMQKAKLMLERGASVTDACLSVGYNDLTHFAKMFKKIVGIKPSEYRSKHKQGA